MTLPLEHSFSAIIAGPSRAGKSTFIAKLIRFHKEMIKPTPKKIYYCYSEWQPLYESACFKAVEFHERAIDASTLDGNINNLVIYDDLLTECGENIEMMFTKYSHHRNASVIFITQNMFHNSKHLRTMSLNTSYLVMFKNPRDVNQIMYLSTQMYGKKSNFLIEAFNDATSVPFGYLFLDLKQETPDLLRVRTNIFPDEKTYIYTSRDEAMSLPRYVVNEQEHESET